MPRLQTEHSGGREGWWRRWCWRWASCYCHVTCSKEEKKEEERRGAMRVRARTAYSQAAWERQARRTRVRTHQGFATASWSSQRARWRRRRWKRKMRWTRGARVGRRSGGGSTVRVRERADGRAGGATDSRWERWSAGAREVVRCRPQQAGIVCLMGKVKLRYFWNKQQNLAKTIGNKKIRQKIPIAVEALALLKMLRVCILLRAPSAVCTYFGCRVSHAYLIARASCGEWITKF